MRRLLIALLSLVAALGLGACGAKEDEVVVGHNEGTYLDLGGLKYQVQISRLLEPASPEDRAYLTGISAADRQLRDGEQWFAVFLRVQNDEEGGGAKPAAEEVTIIDTQETVFRPVELGPENAYAYRGGRVPPRGVLPEPDSPAAESTIQGSLVLFKIPLQNLENRPLRLEISDPAEPRPVEVDLDV